MRNEKSHRPGRANSGDNQHHSDYPEQSRLSRLQELVVSLLIMTQRANLDTNDHAIAWSWFDHTLRQLVEVSHDI
jgi:hypothetical protein